MYHIIKFWNVFLLQYKVFQDSLFGNFKCSGDKIHKLKIKIVPSINQLRRQNVFLKVTDKEKCQSVSFLCCDVLCIDCSGCKMLNMLIIGP